MVAILITIWIARRTTAPLKALGDVARQIAAGDLARRAPTTSRDEVGKVALAFNRMADQMSQTIAAVSAERNRLATVLGALDSGIVFTDEDGRVVLFNPAAMRLLGISMDAAPGRSLPTVLRDHELIATVSAPSQPAGWRAGWLSVARPGARSELPRPRSMPQAGQPSCCCRT